MTLRGRRKNVWVSRELSNYFLQASKSHMTAEKIFTMVLQLGMMWPPEIWVSGLTEGRFHETFCDTKLRYTIVESCS